MITQADVMTLLLEACPSFASPWAEYVASEYKQDDERLLYLDLGAFARHVTDLYEQRRTGEFDAIFDVVERLHKEGDSYVREAATIGLLEGIQNVASYRFDPEVFVPFLRPESARWWRELNAFWQGERRYVGEGLDTESTQPPSTE